MMTFREAVKICLIQKYFFRCAGRAPRSEYWWFYLFTLLAQLGLALLFSLLLLPSLGNIMIAIAQLVFFPPSLGVAVRRLHDVNWSGWWLLAPLIPPFLGYLFVFSQLSWLFSCGLAIGLCAGIGFLILTCLPGTPGPNRFGPNPLMKI